MPPIVEVRPGESPPTGAIPFARSPSGLWLPADFTDIEPQIVHERRAILQFAVTTVGWQAVTGQVATIDQVVERLSRYSLQTVMGLVGRVTLVLNSDGASHKDRLARQTRIASTLLGAEAAQALIDLVGHKKGAEFDPDGFVLFQERQTLNALKLAFLTIDVEASPPDTSLVGFLEALLMLNDLIDPPEGSMGPGIPGGLEAMELYVSANVEFNRSPSLVREYVRSYYLYIDPRPEVSDRGVVDVPALLERATGLPAKTVWNALFALYASWATRSPADIEAGRISTRRTDYLSTLPGLSAEERERWLTLAVCEAADLQARVRRRYSIAEPRYWDVLPFEERPLIAFGDMMFCSSIPLLQRLHGASLQHRLQDHNVFSKKETRRFRDTLGHLVEHYTAEVFSRAFGSRFIPEDALKACAGDASVCDGIIVYPDGLILIECKTASPLLGTRHAENYDQYRKQWRRHIRKAAGQITSTVELLRRGALASIGLASDGDWELYPVVCVFEQTVQPLAYRSVRNVDLAGHSLSAMMAAGTVKSLQLLRIREVEMLESAVEQGRSVLELLREKTSNEENAELPFEHFVHLKGDTFDRPLPKWYAAQWERMINKAKQHFRDLGLRARSDGGEDDDTLAGR